MRGNSTKTNAPKAASELPAKASPRQMKIRPSSEGCLTHAKTPSVFKLTSFAAQGGVPKEALNSHMAESLRKTPQAKSAIPRADPAASIRVII
jgi:hypothetical protein